jgi:hypothetical protein
MPAPHSLTCPCLRCNQRRKPAAPVTGVGGFAIAKPRAPHDYDGLSTKPAPSPKGPPTSVLLEDAKKRRREREAEERERERGGR